MRRAFVDLRPLRESRAFRRLWFGTTLSGFGSQFGTLAGLYYLWSHTRSAAVTGLAGLAAGVPLVALALAGSAFVDQVDRRRLALVCAYTQMAVSSLMAAVAFTGGGVAAMLVLIAVQAGAGAIGDPARRAFVPRLLSRERLAAGLALNHLSFQLVLLLGPATAGLLAAAVGVSWCFVVDAATFTAALAGLYGLPPGVPAQAGTPGLRALRAGLAFALRERAVRGALLADLAATALSMPIALFPVLGAERFGDRPQVFGLFMSALAVGGVAAAVFSGLLTRQARPGVVMLACGALWAVALGATGLSHSLPLSLGLVAVAGAADTWSVVARGTVVQAATPDAYQGRIAALEHVAGEAGPQLGNLRAGLVAAATSGGTALVVGGLTALAAMGALAVTTPRLRCALADIAVREPGVRT